MYTIIKLYQYNKIMTYKGTFITLKVRSIH